MYLRDNETGDLIEVIDRTALVDPTQASFTGRRHSGEELQDPEPFDKAALCFPSGEALPRCWVDPDYHH